MAMRPKRRAVDFSTREMVALSNCDSDKTLDNIINRICQRYGINKRHFRLDGVIEEGRKEVFYPAECAELVALLIRCEEKNPAKRKNANKEKVTATNIRDYYAALLEETEKLPEPFRQLVYCLPCHLVNQKIVIWSDMLVKKLALFADVYISEKGEDLGALLKELSIKMDESTYTLYSTQRMLEGIGEYNWRHVYKSEEELLMEWLYLGAMPVKVLNPFDRETASNIGLDVAIAKVIELIMQDIEDEKSDIQYQKPEEISDISGYRLQYYQKYIGELVKLNGNYNNYAFSVESAKKGAARHKMYSDRVVAGELGGKDELIQHYLDKIAFYQGEIQGLQTRIMLLKEIDEDDSWAKMIQEGYAKKCEELKSSETLGITDKFVGNLLWNFLYEKK